MGRGLLTFCSLARKRGVAPSLGRRDMSIFFLKLFDCRIVRTCRRYPWWELHRSSPVWLVPVTFLDFCTIRKRTVRTIRRGWRDPKCSTNSDTTVSPQIL